MIARLSGKNIAGKPTMTPQEIAVLIAGEPESRCQATTAPPKAITKPSQNFQTVAAPENQQPATPIRAPGDE